MKPSRHIIASLAIGAGLWFFTKSIYGGLLCFISGVFADIDHAIEYIIHFGWKDLTLKNVWLVSEQTGKHGGDRGFKKLYLIFHVGEIAIFLWAATIYTKNIYLLAIALGHSSHLILDCIGNRLYPFSYFILRRFIKGFVTEKLMEMDSDDIKSSFGSVNK